MTKYCGPETPAAENARLHEELARERKRSAALLVDADRREERARKIAGDCAEHGREIRYLRHLASWCWASMVQQEEARWAIVTALQAMGERRHHDGVSGWAAEARTDISAAEISAAIGAQDQVLRRPAGYPALADCLRAGGCDHDGLSDGLRAEIAGALGLCREAGRR